jgi:hypothetical protein
MGTDLATTLKRQQRTSKLYSVQGWQPGSPVTVISDGKAALPKLVRIATGGSIVDILDWWHILMRVCHVEQTLHGVYALAPEHRAGLNIVDMGVKRPRHLIWNGYHDEARRGLLGFRHLASEAVYLKEERLQFAVSPTAGSWPPWPRERWRVCCTISRHIFVDNHHVRVAGSVDAVPAACAVAAGADKLIPGVERNHSPRVAVVTPGVRQSCAGWYPLGLTRGRTPTPPGNPAHDTNR